MRTPQRLQEKNLKIVEEVAAALKRQINESICSKTQDVIEEEEILPEDSNNLDLDEDFLLKKKIKTTFWQIG